MEDVAEVQKNAVECNSAGVILPEELLARLRVEKGEELYAVETRTACA